LVDQRDLEMVREQEERMKKLRKEQRDRIKRREQAELLRLEHVRQELELQVCVVVYVEAGPGADRQGAGAAEAGSARVLEEGADGRGRVQADGATSMFWRGE